MEPLPSRSCETHEAGLALQPDAGVSRMADVFDLESGPQSTLLSHTQKKCLLLAPRRKKKFKYINNYTRAEIKSHSNVFLVIAALLV